MLKTKNLLTECLWFLGCVIFTLLIGLTLFGKAIFEKNIDINLHDTYFVIANQHFFIYFFTIFSFTIYFIKENRHTFNRRLPLGIFLILGLGFNVLLVKASPLFLFSPEITQNGWTVYPPLSVQNTPSDILPKDTPPSTFLTPINFLILFQIIIIALMLYATYKYGKSRVLK